jgi:hypothetical protein
MRNLSASGQPSLRFGKNGQNINMLARHYKTGYSSDYETSTLISITSLGANETVEVFSSDGSVSFYDDDSYFFGYLIG